MTGAARNTSLVQGTGLVIVAGMPSVRFWPSILVVLIRTPLLSVGRCLLLACCRAAAGPPASKERAEPRATKSAQLRPGLLRVHPANPRYFTDGTKLPDGSWKAVYLTGSHTWANLIDRGPGDAPPPFDVDGYLDFLPLGSSKPGCEIAMPRRVAARSRI